MSKVSDFITVLNSGRENPKFEERVKKLAASINVKDNDPFLCLIAVLDHYYNMYAYFPDKIAIAADEAATAAVEQVEQKIKLVKKEVELLAEKQKSNLTSAVNNAALKMSVASSLKSVIKYIAISITVSSLFVVLLSRYFYNQGVEAGKALQRNDEFVLKERDEFAKTSIAKLAAEYHKKGELYRILKCRGVGWKVENGMCFPLAYEKNGKRMVHGWPYLE